MKMKWRAVSGESLMSVTVRWRESVRGEREGEGGGRKQERVDEGGGHIYRFPGGEGRSERPSSIPNEFIVPELRYTWIETDSGRRVSQKRILGFPRPRMTIQKSSSNEECTETGWVRCARTQGRRGHRTRSKFVIQAQRLCRLVGVIMGNGDESEEIVSCAY